MKTKQENITYIVACSNRGPGANRYNTPYVLVCVAWFKYARAVRRYTPFLL